MSINNSRVSWLEKGFLSRAPLAGVPGGYAGASTISDDRSAYKDITPRTS